MASLREVAAVVEAERATAAREIERAREQIANLKIADSTFRGESRRGLHRVGVCFSSQHEMWLTEL
eukprot:3458094-Prymnesium_polylepis.2